ncbi:MAG: phosphonate ABC transporter substrate-binding protein [Rhodoferax sp.]|uniref:phosphonate ABC transporter substrate-binding protein n=1 Tax=Rhodoferax sp. TaxID=50421 RepID=UPI0026066E17|nr:phosphonate ABC transporter substrate-binding protein [Rhodoferax sp.]MDD5336067.1 phosphonate ABC transporter substrate-binding protein [Rhodoferax sp.]
MKKLLFGLTAVLAIAMTPVAAQETKEINFGIIATDSSSSLKKNWEAFLGDMEKSVGVKINPFFATDYAGIIEGMRFNKVQVAYYGNKSAMEAVDRANGEIFAKVISVDGTEGYNSLLITHNDSPYKNVDDVVKHSKEINFGIGDPNSTSGFLVPSYYVFAKNNLNPKTDFKTIRGANHASNFMAAANKQVDVATFNTADYEKMEQSQPALVKNVRIVWKSPLIPADPFVWRKDLSADLKVKIKDFMLSYGKGANGAEQKEKIKLLPAGGFAASSDDQLVPIRQIALFSARIKLEGDSNMDAAEKSKKIADINRKLDELNQKLALLK